MIIHIPPGWAQGIKRLCTDFCLHSCVSVEAHFNVLLSLRRDVALVNHECTTLAGSTACESRVSIGLWKVWQPYGTVLSDSISAMRCTSFASNLSHERGPITEHSCFSGPDAPAYHIRRHDSTQDGCLRRRRDLRSRAAYCTPKWVCVTFFLKVER